MNRNVSSNVLNLLPLGIPTLVIADDPQLIAAAGAIYAYWAVEAPVSEPRIELRLEIGNASPSAEVSLDIAVEGSRLRLTGAGAAGRADSTTLKAHAVVSSELVQDLEALSEVTDTLLLFLLARDGRTPVHASAFMLDDAAVVLAGPSGSGKSTLALAASGRGLPVLSDDMIFVQREPSFAVWGFPRPIHVFPGDAPPGDHLVRLRNGKRKAALPNAAPASKAVKSTLVVLERGSALAIERIDPRPAVDALMTLDSGFDLLRAESEQAAQALASAGAWRLTLTDDPARAVDLLLDHFRGASAR